MQKRIALSAAELYKTYTRPWLYINEFTRGGALERVPEHYKKFYYDWKYGPREPVHYILNPAKFEKLSNGTVVPVQNVPIPLKFPKELNEGIWGGEAVIKGFEKRKARTRRIPHYWVPELKSTVVYSEILDKYIQVTITERALNLIDQHYGLDSYILQTSPADLMSMLALKLKREILLALIRKTLYPDNPEKRDKIYKKYEKYIISEEEADWIGLSLGEAGTKQEKIEAEANKPVPMKHAFRKEFIEYLKNNQDLVETEERGIIRF